MRDPRDIIRFLKAKTVTNGDPVGALAFAKSNYGPDSVSARLLQKDVMATGDLGDDPDFRAAGRAFLDIVKNRSLIGKIQAAVGFNMVPFHTGVLVQSEAPVATWTGEGQSIQLASAKFERASIPQLKLATIIPMTTELMKGVGATFEVAMSRELSRAISDLEGSSFIDPANAGSPDVAPPSITNGVTPVTASADPKASIAALLEAFEGDLETAVFVASPAAGLALYNSGYEGAGAAGGEVAGIPLVTSSAVPGLLVALIDAAGILMADDGVVMDISEQAVLFAADGSTLNLYQENLVAIKAVRLLNWIVGRAGSVSYLYLEG